MGSALCSGVARFVLCSSGFVVGLVAESLSGSAGKSFPPASGVVGSGVGSIGCGDKADIDTSSDVFGADGVCGVCSLLADDVAWCVSDAPLALRASAVQTTTWVETLLAYRPATSRRGNVVTRARSCDSRLSVLTACGPKPP